MLETKGYRLWYWHWYDYSSEWIQAVIIDAHKAGVLAIDANGEVIVASNILIHHDQNRMKKLVFLIQNTRNNVSLPEHSLSPDKHFYACKDEDDIPPMSVSIRGVFGSLSTSNTLSKRDHISQSENDKSQEFHKAAKVNRLKCLKSKGGRRIWKHQPSIYGIQFWAWI